MLHLLRTPFDAHTLAGMQELLRRISTWLRPDGLLFVHMFCHARYAYHFEVSSRSAVP